MLELREGEYHHLPRMEELQAQMNDDEVKSRVRSFFPGTASYVVVKAILSVSSTVSR